MVLPYPFQVLCDPREYPRIVEVCAAGASAHRAHDECSPAMFGVIPPEQGSTRVPLMKRDLLSHPCNQKADSVNFTLTGIRTAEVKVVVLFICAKEVLYHALLHEPDLLVVLGDFSYILLYEGELGLPPCADLDGAAGIERLAKVSALRRF